MSHPTLETFRWPVLLAVALLLAGCPYSSDFPLDDPAEATADGALLGAWKATGEGEEDFTLTIRSSGDAQLLIVAESPGEEPESFSAFVSGVGGEAFLNFQETAEGGQWFFANYRIEGDRLSLRLVDDELLESESFASAEDLRAFLLQNLDNPGLYGREKAEDWVLVRLPGKRM